MKELDVPAYKRRTLDSTATESTSEATDDKSESAAKEKKRVPRVTVRKLSSSDVSDVGEERPKAEKDDSNTPAFLRKMMD